VETLYMISRNLEVNLAVREAESESEEPARCLLTLKFSD